MKYYQIASPATEKSLVTGRINPSGKLYCCLILRDCLQQTTLISQQPSTWGQDPPTHLKYNHDVKSQIENVTFHHEGFFWRCWFNGIAEENDSSIWKFWYTNQPPSKNCMHAYLSPYPFTRGEHNSTSYDSAVIYRGFWAVLMLLGVVAVVTASFLIICAAPFASHVLYKAGGGGYIAAGSEQNLEDICGHSLQLGRFLFRQSLAMCSPRRFGHPVFPGGDAVCHLGPGSG
ncbi:transmembrane protein 182 isoform X3 [Felis catus]|uniref:transmembrane protein 182 isoform X3 n=1 Tax=Felis catus TaxID=9685 RepID=UPI001D19938C|nr:transmembrane protein 182 isoform X3 [Felis catus]